MLIYDNFSKKCHAILKKFFLLLWKFLSYLVCLPSFKSINSSSLSRKKYIGDNLTSTLCKRLRSQNISVEIRLIELTEPSKTLHFTFLFRYCILQNILHVFLLFIFVWNKIFCPKEWAVFYIFLIWFGLVFGVTVLKVLCFWCPFYKVLGNKGFISYSRYILLGTAIKTVL